MKIVNHKIQGVKEHAFKTSDSFSSPKLIVIHYTAGGSLLGSANYLKRIGF